MQIDKRTKLKKRGIITFGKDAISLPCMKISFRLCALFIILSACCVLLLYMYMPVSMYVQIYISACGLWMWSWQQHSYLDAKTDRKITFVALTLGSPTDKPHHHCTTTAILKDTRKNTLKQLFSSLPFVKKVGSNRCLWGYTTRTILFTAG